MWVPWLVVSVVRHILINNIKSELSVRGAKRDVENIQKCTRLTVSWPHNPIPDLVIMMIMVVVCNVSFRSGFVCRTHGASLIGLREISKYSGFHDDGSMSSGFSTRDYLLCHVWGFTNNFFYHILSRAFCAFLLQLQLVGFALELSPHKSVFTSTGMFSLKENWTELFFVDTLHLCLRETFETV